MLRPGGTRAEPSERSIRAATAAAQELQSLRARLRRHPAAPAQLRQPQSQCPQRGAPRPGLPPGTRAGAQREPGARRPHAPPRRSRATAMTLSTEMSDASGLAEETDIDVVGEGEDEDDEEEEDDDEGGGGGPRLAVPAQRRRRRSYAGEDELEDLEEEDDELSLIHI